MIYYNQSKSQVIKHKFVAPSSLGLLDNDAIVNPSTSQQVPPKALVNPTDKRKVGRPRNDSKKPIEKEVDSYENDELMSRAKSRRVVKTNSDISKIFLTHQDMTSIMEPQLSKTFIDPDIPIQQSELKLLPAIKKQRKISSEFRCTSCKKIYLGKNKMNQHYKLFPDHRPKVSENESALFTHLMKMVRLKKKKKDMADVFFNELSNFVQLCEKLTPKLITNQDNPNTHHHIIDKNAANLLRINPGNYRLNMNVFEKNFKLDSLESIEDPTVLDMNEAVDNSDLKDHHCHDELEPVVTGNEVIKALDDVLSLDGNEVNLLIRQTNELTNLTNISDIVGETEKIGEHIVDGDNALLGF